MNSEPAGSCFWLAVKQLHLNYHNMDTKEIPKITMIWIYSKYYGFWIVLI